MCQMRIVMKKDDAEEVILENAALLEATDDGIRVNALFEEPKFIKGARVSAIDFLQGRVTVTSTRGKA